MKKQGSNSRLDESLGMRRGKESSKSQSYKDRRDESRGMSKGMGKVMGHDKSPYKVSVPEGQGFAQVKPFHDGNDGYPKQAFDYKY